MMHIACGANSTYMPHAAAMLHSLLSQPRDGTPVTIHFMHGDGLADSELDRLERMVRSLGGIWQPHHIGPELLQPFPQNWRFGREAWYRVLLPELLPDQSKVLYLDADTIVLRSLLPLWLTDLGGATAGAVANPLYPFMDASFISELGLQSAAEYFNSGMLLLNLERWRHEGLTQKLLTFVAEHGKEQQWPDQNALNVILRGRWLPLAPIWNAQNVYFDLRPAQLPFPTEQIKELRAAPGIVHFIAPYKPWDYLCKHPYRQRYFDHLAQTPWRGAPMQGVTWKNRLLRLLPQPFMWLLMVRLRLFSRRLRARLRG
ncbi:MAG: glycosyltransferase family 8 protein [Stenotrophobium sp.]